MANRERHMQMTAGLADLLRPMWVERDADHLAARLAPRLDKAVELTVYAVAEAHSKQLSDVVGYARTAFIEAIRHD